MMALRPQLRTRRGVHQQRIVEQIAQSAQYLAHGGSAESEMRRRPCHVAPVGACFQRDEPVVVA